MDRSSGHQMPEGPAQGPEQHTGFEVIELGKKDLAAYKDKIATIRWDALNQMQYNPETLGLRGVQQGLKGEYLAKGQHGRLFGFMQGGDLKAIVAARTPDDSRIATIKEISLTQSFKEMDGPAQKRAFEALFRGLIEKLPLGEGKFARAEIIVPADQEVRPSLKDALGHPPLSTYFPFREEESKAEPPKDVGAANDNISPLQQAA